MSDWKRINPENDKAFSKEDESKLKEDFKMFTEKAGNNHNHLQGFIISVLRVMIILGAFYIGQKLF